MCQHNKAGVVASSRHDKVGDIECLAPDPSGGDGPSGEERERERRRGDRETREWVKKKNDGEKSGEGE